MNDKLDLDDVFYLEDPRDNKSSTKVDETEETENIGDDIFDSILGIYEVSKPTPKKEPDNEKKSNDKIIFKPTIKKKRKKKLRPKLKISKKTNHY
jgi:hypothetical protein